MIGIFENVQMPMSLHHVFNPGVLYGLGGVQSLPARSVEATVLLVAAIVVMLAQVPLGVKIYKNLPVISQWIRTFQILLPNVDCHRRRLGRRGHIPENTLGNRTLIFGRR
jgi:hypothetical protein